MRIERKHHFKTSTRLFFVCLSVCLSVVPMSPPPRDGFTLERSSDVSTLDLKI